MPGDPSVFDASVATAVAAVAASVLTGCDVAGAETADATGVLTCGTVVDVGADGAAVGGTGVFATAVFNGCVEAAGVDGLFLPIALADLFRAGVVLLLFTFVGTTAVFGVDLEVGFVLRAELAAASGLAY